ncbi:MAG: TetR/AcrR family transcriptional regulator [bacterium]
MKKFELKKLIIIKIIGEYILENGIKNASLKNLADAAKTSDRMLLHYFKDKEEMLTLTLTYITENFINLLEKTRTEKMPFYSLIPYLYKEMKETQIKPYIKLWIELIALSSKKEEPFYSISRQICNSFISWINTAIQVNNEEEKDQVSAIALATIEGFVILDALDYDCQIIKAIEGIKQKT